MTFSATFDTGLHADCVRFVPGKDEEITVFSCYELDERTNKRLGKLILAERHGNEVYEYYIFKLADLFREVVQCIDSVPGVFEFSWFPSNSNILVTALAEGAPKLFKYEENGLVPLVTKCSEEGLEMTLAVAGEAECFLTCDNKGFLRQWSLKSGGEMELEQCWRGHDAEIWFVSRDIHDGNLFYTGSDDYSLKGWDMRCDPTQTATFSNKNGHEAGVCCIAPSPWEEFVLATGSYDEKVRLWDRRFMRGAPIQSIECGSGAWRVVWNPLKRDEMAVAAMRAGFHILNLERGYKIQKSESVGDHVAYGIDWHANGTSLASCSFYNNQGQFFSTK